MGALGLMTNTVGLAGVKAACAERFCSAGLTLAAIAADKSESTVNVGQLSLLHRHGCIPCASAPFYMTIQIAYGQLEA